MSPGTGTGLVVAATAIRVPAGGSTGAYVVALVAVDDRRMLVRLPLTDGNVPAPGAVVQLRRTLSLVSSDEDVAAVDRRE